jgi:chromosome segregation ATPase
MKRYILEALKRMGYAVVHIEVWHDKLMFDSRLAQSASQLHGAEARIEDLEQQLVRERESFRAQIVALDAQLMETKAQLALSAKHMARLDLRIQALKRRRDFFGAEMHKVQDQLASTDVSGRIRDLEDEKDSLQRRLGDLEVFFTERQNASHSKLSG